MPVPHAEARAPRPHRCSTRSATRSTTWPSAPTPTVREVSARAAELTAIAADKAAPLAKKAGDATADASGKLAERSRHWAEEVRGAMAGAEAAAHAVRHATTADPAATPTPADTTAERGLRRTHGAATCAEARPEHRSARTPTA